MCKKNFEGKQLSFFPFDEDDINDETIVDNDINDDNLITDDKDNIVVGASKRKKRSKKKTTSKSCKTCYRDIIENENRDMLRFTNTFHQVSAKNYCNTHETSHTDHKCKPHWCGDCGFLLSYEISINFDKYDK